MTRKSDKAFFAGTFNPFTVGHKSIVDRTLGLFGEVVIGIGRNINKPGDDAEGRAASIRRAYNGNPRVSVMVYEGLTAEAARSAGAAFLIRGVRGASDFEYERTLAEANLRLFGMETLLLPALPELSFVSSSMVRELTAHGQDVSQWIATGTQAPDDSAVR